MARPPAGQAVRDVRADCAARLESVTQKYGSVLALDDLNLSFPKSCVVGLIGPDGVGKSSLLSLIAGARRIQSGSVTVLGADMARVRDRKVICPRVAYMPQGLGKNLYPDLSVRENIEFFARLFGQGRGEREARIADLLKSTDLTPFAGRQAKRPMVRSTKPTATNRKVMSSSRWMDGSSESRARSL